MEVYVCDLSSTTHSVVCVLICCAVYVKFAVIVYYDENNLCVKVAACDLLISM
jgi:hypothetical protein